MTLGQVHAFNTFMREKDINSAINFIVTRLESADMCAELMNEPFRRYSELLDEVLANMPKDDDNLDIPDSFYK